MLFPSGCAVRLDLTLSVGATTTTDLLTTAPPLYLPNYQVLNSYTLESEMLNKEHIGIIESVRGVSYYRY